MQEQEGLGHEASGSTRHGSANDGADVQVDAPDLRGTTVPPLRRAEVRARIAARKAAAIGP